MPTNPGSCSVDGATDQAACTLLDALNDATPGRTFELATDDRQAYGIWVSALARAAHTAPLLHHKQADGTWKKEVTTMHTLKD